MIVAIPAEIPATIPDEEPMLTSPAPPLHVPPPASVNVIVDPTHTVAAPVIADGNGFTVTVAVRLHPVLIV